MKSDAKRRAREWQAERQQGGSVRDEGLTVGSQVDNRRKKPKELRTPVWGTKSRPWGRSVHAEMEHELRLRDERRLEKRAKLPAESGGQGEKMTPRAPLYEAEAHDQR